VTSDDAPEPTSDASPDAEPPAKALALVVEVSHAGVVVGDRVQDAAVGPMMTRGMLELTGKATEAAAWSSLFDPTDVVGIKVSPVGYPSVYSHAATVNAIIHGLNLAGVTNDKIVVFDRYKDYLDSVGYPALLPAGIQFVGVVPTYTEDQTDITGYDPLVFVDLPRVYPGDDATDPSKRRSHLVNVVSNVVTKVINVPALKDHISAGITCALKNMTYGCVSNVSRTHCAPDNWTKDFIPAIAAIPRLRQKVVLHIADALVACYDGGPGPPGGSFKPFVRSSLLFSRDPVALDRIGWEILDTERAKNGLPALANTGGMLVDPSFEPFDERQPQHVLAAGAAGLGIADLAKIEHRQIAI
jgi:hypothetical protein